MSHTELSAACMDALRHPVRYAFDSTSCASQDLVGAVAHTFADLPQQLLMTWWMAPYSVAAFVVLCWYQIRLAHQYEELADPAGDAGE